jgi:RNA-binding protein
MFMGFLRQRRMDLSEAFVYSRAGRLYWVTGRPAPGESMDLKGYQRGYLTRKAHLLQPVVHIGKFGLTDEVVAAVDKALEDHELIKVKFVNFKDEKDDLAREVGSKIDATLVRLVGNIAIYYRHQEDPQKRVVHLPK